jgi:hypothetical protein
MNNDCLDCNFADILINERALWRQEYQSLNIGSKELKSGKMQQTTTTSCYVKLLYSK